MYFCIVTKINKMAKNRENIETNLSKAEEIAKLKKDLEKEYGKGSLIGAKDKPLDCEIISTGSLGLDLALGIGGLPKGRIIEIYGSESSGKTTLTLETIAQAHKNNLNSYCAVIDAEHALDTFYCNNLGVDLNRLEINQPDNGEQALNIAESLLDSKLFDIIVIDSVAALVPKSELDGEMGDSAMGKHARLMSQAMRKLTGKVAKSNTILIFINQLRDKIGVMFGDPSTTTGGNALKFYASIRLEVSRSTTSDNSVMHGNEKIGNLTKVKVIKNKLAPPFKKCEFDILYGQGIDKISEIIDMASDLDLIKKWGKTITILDETDTKYDIEVFKTLLKDNEEFFQDLKNKIIQKIQDENK